MRVFLNILFMKIVVLWLMYHYHYTLEVCKAVISGQDLCSISEVDVAASDGSLACWTGCWRQRCVGEEHRSWACSERWHLQGQLSHLLSLTYAFLSLFIDRKMTQSAPKINGFVTKHCLYYLARLLLSFQVAALVWSYLVSFLTALVLSILWIGNLLCLVLSYTCITFLYSSKLLVCFIQFYCFPSLFRNFSAIFLQFTYQSLFILLTFLGLSAFR